MAQTKREESEDSAATVKTASSARTDTDSNVHQPQPFDWSRQLLEEQGITDYHPAILDILHDYSYQYLSSILKEAAENVLHRSDGKADSIELEDVEFAKRQIHKSKAHSPLLIDVMQDAAQVNRIPLPFVSHHFKMKLPPKPYSLTSQNYQLDHD
mmetsp:Transcript_36438/g.58425  ORF Transcript_36438/g.58425 Transcript_36438/m.58425 type:complete len:155 (+) Transcript_36438:53-517(+)